MAGPDPAVAAVRTAVRRLLDDAALLGHLDDGLIAVACSGGADSLALAAAAVHVARHLNLDVHGLIVDHGLQENSAEVAAEAARTITELGVTTTQILTPTVAGPGGPEAAARRARYGALLAARPTPRTLVLLGHTRDDQAETVLLGLGRGSGPRSIAGMRPLDPPWARPFLNIARTTTVAACAALGLRPWSDPHNAEPRFTRVRLRAEVLPLLEEVLQGGVADALARTANQVREDNDALDAIARDTLAAATHAAGLSCADLIDTHPAIRRRVIRLWLIAGGVSEFTDEHLRTIDRLISDWCGQGAIPLPGGRAVERAKAHLGLR